MSDTAKGTGAERLTQIENLILGADGSCHCHFCNAPLNCQDCDAPEGHRADCVLIEELGYLFVAANQPAGTITAEELDNLVSDFALKAQRYAHDPSWLAKYYRSKLEQLGTQERPPYKCCTEECEHCHAMNLQLHTFDIPYCSGCVERKRQISAVTVSETEPAAQPSIRSLSAPQSTQGEK